MQNFGTAKLMMLGVVVLFVLSALGVRLIPVGNQVLWAFALWAAASLVP